MNVANWLTSAQAAQASDTAQEIADAPVTLNWRRAGASLGALTVRVVAPLSAFGAGMQRSDASAADTSGVVIVAPAGTDLRADDELAGAGGMYRVTFVPPGQHGRIEARAEVLSL